MARNLEFLFDVGSPAAYLAWTQLPALCEKTGAVLTLRNDRGDCARFEPTRAQ